MSDVNENEDKKYEMNHDYDGIRELNYPAPTWWQVVFLGTIVWAFGYFAYYYMFEGETLRHKLDRQLVELERERLKAGTQGPGEDELMALVSNPEALASGKATFQVRCVSCHGEHGQGVIGPNLTDDYWIHGKGTAADIYTVVDKGVSDKGMPPWGPILPPKDVKNLVAYVKSLRGTKPENPKAPQGLEVKP